MTLLIVFKTLYMTMRREKNNHENDPLHSGRNKPVKDENYADENTYSTDSDAAEANPRIRQASELAENDIEEGDEDYDDEKE